MKIDCEPRWRGVARGVWRYNPSVMIWERLGHLALGLSGHPRSDAHTQQDRVLHLHGSIPTPKANTVAYRYPYLFTCAPLPY